MGLPIEDGAVVVVPKDQMELQKTLNEVDGKYQYEVLALLVLAPPSGYFSELDSSGNIERDHGSFQDQLRQLGFSEGFILKITLETLQLIRVSNTFLNSLRGGLFGQGTGSIPLSNYDGAGHCRLQKLISQVQSARSRESVLKAAILNANGL